MHSSFIYATCNLILVDQNISIYFVGIESILILEALLLVFLPHNCHWILFVFMFLLTYLILISIWQTWQKCILTCRYFHVSHFIPLTLSDIFCKSTFVHSHIHASLLLLRNNNNNNKKPQTNSKTVWTPTVWHNTSKTLLFLFWAPLIRILINNFQVY